MVCKKWVITLFLVLMIFYSGCKVESGDSSANLPLVYAVVSPYDNAASVFIGTQTYSFKSLSVSVNGILLTSDGSGNYDTNALPALNAGNNVTLIITGEENSRAFNINVSALVPTSAINIAPASGVNWKFNSNETVTCTPGNGARTTYVVYDYYNENSWITSYSIASSSFYTFTSSKNNQYILDNTSKVKVTVISSNKTYIVDNTDYQSALIVEQENSLQTVIRNTVY